MKRIVSIFLLLLVSTFQFSHAAARSKTIYTAETVGEFFDVLGKQLDQKSTEFLRNSAKGIEGLRLLVRASDSGKFQITVGTTVIAYQYLGSNKDGDSEILINGKKVVIELGEEVEKWFPRIQDALPRKSQGNAVWHFVVSEAYAQTNQGAAVASVAVGVTIDQRDNKATPADLEKCNPVIVRDLSEKIAMTLLCNSLKKENVKSCMATMLTGGIASFLAGLYIKGSSTSLAGNTAAYADMYAATRKNFSPEVRQMIDNLKSRSGDSRVLANIIYEMKKKPEVFKTSLIGFSKSMRMAQAATFLKAVGVLSYVGYLSDLFVTPPDDCPKLKWDNLKEEDKKWVTFGWNCSRQINTDFFTLPFEEQMKVTARSPDICRSVPRFKEDLENFLRSVQDEESGPSAPETTKR